MAFRITRIPQTFRNIQRLRTIVSVLAKYGFADVVAGLASSYEWVKYKITCRTCGVYLPRYFPSIASRPK